MKIFSLFFVCAFTVTAYAELIVRIESTKRVGKKTVVKLDLKNNFAEKIESARAQVFLTADNGKMVGQKTAWVIGGAKDHPALEPGKETTYNFVINTDKPFIKTKIGFSKIILDGGKIADVSKSVEVAP